MYLLIGIYLQKKSGGTLRNIYIMGRNLPKISSIRSNKINNKNLHCFYQATLLPISDQLHWFFQIYIHNSNLQNQVEIRTSYHYGLLNKGMVLLLQHML